MSNNPVAPAISLRNVGFAYIDDHPVLDIESLEVAPGRRLFLHGPSGSGKTTFLSLISGILLPQAGEVRVLGHDLKRLSPSARDILRGSDVGYIFQNFNLIPYLTVRENIALPCSLHAKRRSRMGSLSVAEEVHRIATRLDIHTHLDAPVTHLSTGQQQRVAIARAIIGSPPLVIADEPTSSLDADRRDAFLTLLTEMIVETQSTLLFVSHDLSLACHFDESLSLPSLNRCRTIVQDVA
jgi:putative ABC transport system ATP-binding protein